MTIVEDGNDNNHVYTFEIISKADGILLFAGLAIFLLCLFYSKVNEVFLRVKCFKVYEMWGSIIAVGKIAPF